MSATGHKATSAATNEPPFFDIHTVLLLREVLADAWASLRPEQRATASKTLLAERILKAAAAGERDPERLVNAAHHTNDFLRHAPQ
jgi:hypothetical protein